MNWKSIYWSISREMQSLEDKRGISVGGVSDGIAVMQDPIALRWQRLSKILRHVGCHSFAQRDRSVGMEGKCYYQRVKEARK